jgi:hypothetical protein
MWLLISVENLWTFPMSHTDTWSEFNKSYVKHQFNVPFIPIPPSLCPWHLQPLHQWSCFKVRHVCWQWWYKQGSYTHTKIIGVLPISTAIFVVSLNSYIKITACFILCRAPSGDVCVKILKESRSLTTQFLTHSSHNTGRDNIELPAPTERATWSK